MPLGIKTQFVTNQQGKKLCVLLTIKDYNKLVRELEELDDIRTFDSAIKTDNGSRVLLSDYLKKRRSKNAKVHSQLN